MKHISKSKMADIFTIYIIIIYLVSASVLTYYNALSKDKFSFGLILLAILICLIQILGIKDELASLKDK